MPTKQNIVKMSHWDTSILQGAMTSKETIDAIFNDLENQLLDKREITVDLKNVTFSSVYFLERLERFIEKGKGLSIEIKIINTSPEIYKVFQVARLHTVLNLCL